MATPGAGKVEHMSKATLQDNKQEEQLAVLQELNRVIASGSSTEQMMQMALAILLEQMDYQAAQIYQLTNTGKDIWLYLEAGKGSKPVSQIPDIFPVDEINIVTDTVRQKGRVYIPDVGLANYSYFGDLETKTWSEIALPLTAGPALIGVLRVQAAHIHAFNEREMEFLNSIAQLLGTTIDNHRKIDRLEDSIQEIKTLYTLQYQSTVEEQQQRSETSQAVGYEYNHHELLKQETPVLSPDQIPPHITTRQEGEKQLLLAPIRLHGETIGVLGMEETDDAAAEWDDDAISLLEEVSSQVGLAIENARLLQQTQQQTKDLTILFEAARQLTETIDLREIYDILTNQIISYLQADRCSVLLLTEARTHFQTLVIKGRDPRNNLLTVATPRTEAIDSLSLFKEMMTEPRLLTIHRDDLDLTDDLAYYLSQSGPVAIQTLTLLPLVVRGRLVGLVEVAHLGKPHHYHPNELQLAQAIISQVTVAVENAQLFQQTQLSLQDTQKLYNISRRMVETASVNDIFNVILENVRNYEVDRVSISLLERAGKSGVESVNIVASWDRDPKKFVPVGTRFQSSNYSLVKSFAQPPFQPLISEDLRSSEQDPRMDEDFRLFVLNKLGAQTMFSAPMFIGSEYKGVLSIYTRRPHSYSNREIRIYQTLADQGIIAIENYRLLEATRLERDRARLLYQLGEMLSNTTTIEQVQAVVLEIIDQVGAPAGELMITDGAEFSALASTIPERQQIPNSEVNRLIMGNGHEALALSHQEILELNSDEVIPEKWPLHNLSGMESLKSMACVPFFSQRSTLQGVLSFFSTELDAFSAEHLATFESIAIQTSAALENVWLLRHTNHVLLETELLYTVTRGFNSVQRIEDILRVLSENLLDPDIDVIAVAELTEQNQVGQAEQLHAEFCWYQDDDRIAPSNLVLRADAFSFIKRFNTQNPTEVYVNTLSSAEQTLLDERLDGIQTLLATPMTVGREWLGMLLMVSKKPGFLFKVNTINQSLTVAGQAAVAIKNLRLTEETQRNLRHSEILSSLGRELLAAESSDQIYNLALDAIAVTEPGRGIAIFMYDQIQDTIELELIAAWDNPRQSWPATTEVGMRLSTEKMGLEALSRTGLTMVSNDGSQDERFSPGLRQLLTMMQIKALVATPLWLKYGVSGFILVGNDNDTPFEREIIQLYENIARETSGALENRRLFDEAQHRAWQLQTAAEISQGATASLELDVLLSDSVELIKKRFDFYHTSIFLVDKYQRYAEVRASTGAIGQKMLAMHHKLEVGGRSIVGTATGTGQPRIALDVGKDAVHFNNPLLPDTRSEMALPLIAQGRVIGALDVQSTRRGAFSDSDITVLQSMANQLANAIEAARAYQESRESLDEVSKLHQRYLMNQWDTYLSEQDVEVGYRLDGEDQISLINLAEDETSSQWAEQQPLKDKKAMVVNVDKTPNGAVPIANQDKSIPGEEVMRAQGTTEPHLIAPLTLYGQSIIGTLDVALPGQNESDWDEELLPIIEAVSSQAAQAIESARLYAQSQVAREEAEALYEVGRKLVTVENEVEMFNMILGKMLKTLGLIQGGVLLFNPDRKSGRLYALYRDGERVNDPDLVFPVAENMSYQKLIETRQPVVIEDMATDPLVATVREMGLVGNIASLLLIPIVIEDHVVGALGADAVDRIHRFTEREINLAMAMADQLSIALQNRRLIAETQHRAMLLQTSANVARVASSYLDEDTLMDETVELIRDGFGFFYAQIYLTTPDGEYLVPHKYEELGLRERFKVGSEHIIGQTAARRKPVIVEYANAEESEAADLLPEVRAELAIPLSVQDTILGVLKIEHIEEGGFSDEETATLQTLASQLAVAIQNARAFTEQQRTTERLKEVDKLKTQFLANMSHELRTPLNSIIGFSRVILKGIDGPLTELQKADLTSIYNSGQHLLGLINNILDLSKIEAGKMELNFEDTEVEPIIKTVMSTAIALVKDKNVELIQQVPDDLPTIWADPTRIRQIVLNLVSNACKFTEEGTVTTRVWAEKGKVVFSVGDTGMGIPPEQLDHIFEEFTQVDGSTTRKVGGTGLGLPISRHFVEMHHGQIWVESAIGTGTTFSFSIPTVPPANASEDDDTALTAVKDSSKPQPPRRVVAIDDDSGVIDLYRRYLEPQGYEIIGVTNGEEAVGVVKREHPFAVLLDIIIPEKDGWHIIKELKDSATTRNIPVVICSIVSDKNRGFSLGASNYLVKPIVESELLDALKHLNNHYENGLKVLVVDDHADDVLLIRRLLEAQEDYTIFEAGNGQEGMEIVELESPDLIILDLNMPKMDGFEMIEALKANEATRSIPIIIVSAQELTPEEQEKLTGQVEVLLRKGIFTEHELLQDVGLALDRITPQEKALI
jgi:GAF domain-containing protein/DNA-binding response OmpR family regulator